MLRSVAILSILLVVGIISVSFYKNTDSSTHREQRFLSAEENYKNYCSGCHGEKMDAFVDRKWKFGNKESDLFKAIKKGYPDAGMPSFDSAFTDEEINDLVDYIITGINNVKKYDFTEPATSNIFKSELVTVRLDTVVSGLSSPWGMAFLPGGDMAVTDKTGKLYRVSKNGQKQEISGVPEVLAEGQGGLLDIELHPSFEQNQFIYLSYSKPNRTDSGLFSTTAIARARLSGNALTEVKDIFVALPYSKTRHHYGSRMDFGKDGYLYFSVGDRGAEKVNPQNLKTHAGKTHRIKDDGSIPDDNPFVKTPDAMPSIFSYGHRNQQGLFIHPGTGAVWSTEHGPRGGDEINISEKGKNYGWPVISYGINYNGTVLTDKTSLVGMEQPLLYYLPSIGPSGFAFVTTDKYPGWKGSLLVGSLRFKYLELCKLNGNKVVKQEILLKNIGRVRDVRVGPDGYIYVSVERPGNIFRLVPIKG